MEYTRQPKTGIQRFLEQAAANNNPNPPQLLMSGHVMNAPRGLESVGRGIAKLLAAPEQEKQAMVYGTAQQKNLASGNLEQAAADAAQSGDMESAIKLAQVAENAKYRGATLGIQEKELANKKMFDTDAVEYANMVSNLPELQKKVEDMKVAGKKATYTTAGKTKDAILKQFGKSTEGADAAVQYESMLNTQILPLLKQTFGAAFTEKDREALQTTMGDPNLTPDQKAVALDVMIAQKQQDMRTKEGVLRYKGIDPEDVARRTGVVKPITKPNTFKVVGRK